MSADAPASTAATVAEAFGAVVSRHADQCALVSGANALTYRELDRQSNRVARSLLSTGRRVPVVVTASLSIDTIVVMLGALKAGRILAPLDPRDPPDRVAHVRACLGAVDVIDAATAWAERDDDPGVRLGAQQPSIVYFTSGSNGLPKGVLKSHVQLVHAADAGFIHAADRVALALPLAFAASITPVFGTLLSGATGCLFDPAVHGVIALADWLETAGVTVIQTPPSALRTMAVHLEARDHRLPSVRLAIVGGEACRASDLAGARRVMPGATILNLYGASEAGYVAFTTVAPGQPLTDDLAVFRHTLPWQTVDVIDDAGRPVPDGEPGEIRVRGADISLRYWNAPPEGERDFTDEPDGTRSIRTGDCGRRRADGALEQLGRLDLRVKMRGHMVDLQAVERALTAVPGIREAAVSAVVDRTRDVRLVAHLVASSGSPPSVPALHAALRARLAAFMIPAVFEYREVLPRNSRGKLDREALRERAAATHMHDAGDFAGTRTTVVAALSEVAGRLLRQRDVDAHADLLDEGLDSLAVAELLATIRARLGVGVSLAQLLEEPTIAALAARIEEARPSADRVLCPLVLDGAGMPFFCVAGGGGDMVGLRNLARRLDRPTYSFVARGFETRARPDRRVESAAARYEAAIRAVRPHGPYLIGGCSSGGLVALEIARRLRAAGEDVAMLALLDPVSGGGQLNGRPIRARVERGAGAARVLAAGVWRAAGLVAVATAGLVWWGPRWRRFALVQASSRGFRHYRPQPYEGDVALLRTAEWPDVDRLDLRRVLSASARVIDVGGTHATMLEAPHVDRLAAPLRQALAVADDQSERRG